ncbi:MAG TPA: zf-HC2 domain-containing protein [Planctomycetota bacterium]|nr:zf-HC2 domain-containing protein [Planctomycetota bacterium]
MLCTEEMGTLLSRYVDGELAEKERKSIEAHLETCASCRDVLNLFQRNDNVLNNALVGEAFGAQTVDAVMTEIRRLEEPMVVAPAVEDEPAPPPVAMRQVIQVTRMWPFAAAAALMIACVGGFLAVAKYGGFGGSERKALEGQLAEVRKTVEQRSASHSRELNAMLDRIQQQSQDMRDSAVKDKLRSTKESTGIAYVNDRAIVVQANFPTDKFFPFEVHRAKELRPGVFSGWERIRTDLPTPHYRDMDVAPGVNYMYSIRAIYRDSDFKRFENSASVIQNLPLGGGLDPRKSLRIRFIGAMPDLKQATFEVSKYDNENQIRALFTVKIGDKIGDVQTIDGQEVDFSTRYVLASIAPSEERISFGTDHLVRPSRTATLRADKAAKDLLVAGFSLMLENEQYIPLPK